MLLCDYRVVAFRNVGDFVGCSLSVVCCLGLFYSVGWFPWYFEKVASFWCCIVFVVCVACGRECLCVCSFRT